MDINAPQLSPQKTHRSAGVIMFALGLVFVIGEYLGFLATGRVFAILLAFPVVLIPAGLYMMATGKNPFEKLRKR
ncbi:MAG: hypothetical protein WC654_08555 [Patescibacteria group bacterium]